MEATDRAHQCAGRYRRRGAGPGDRSARRVGPDERRARGAAGRRGPSGGRGTAARGARETARGAYRVRARRDRGEARRETRARSVPCGRGAARGMTIELTIFRTGAVKLARASFAPWLGAPERDELVECPVWSALLRTPEGLIVFDTGL